MIPCGSSPRPWGCFRKKRIRPHDRSVFPTPVGVFLPISNDHLLLLSLPHARGGVSIHSYQEGSLHWSSPRPWGCFLIYRRDTIHFSVFPTPVGVFPIRKPGGDKRKSSPRPWGCFHHHLWTRWLSLVFPTPVGVFLYIKSQVKRHGRLPHARGGVSP